MEYHQATIIVPTLNEEKNIPALIDRLLQLYPEINVMICDDGSRDRTQGIVKDFNSKHKRITLLDRSGKKVKGLTASVFEGLMKATTKYCIVMDADLQHPPEKIAEIFKYMDEGYDLVIGTRVKVPAKWGLLRRTMSKTGIFLGRLRLIHKGFSCKDLMSGFFGINPHFFRRVAEGKSSRFEMHGYKVLFDILKISPGRTRIKEVNYSFSVRSLGKSKIGKKVIFYYLRSLFI